MQILHFAFNARTAPALRALVVFAAALATFITIALVFNVRGDANPIDVGVGAWLHARATPRLNDLMRAVSFLGAPTTLSVVALAGSGWLFCRRRKLESATLSIVVLGGNGLNLWLKQIFERGRPVFDDPISSLPTYSFPSGHAMASTIFYALLAIHASRSARQRRSGYIAGTAAVSMIALVCTSRLYLGLHYASDVAAAISEAIAWLALSFGVLRFIPHGAASQDRDADR